MGDAAATPTVYETGETAVESSDEEVDTLAGAADCARAVGLWSEHFAYAGRDHPRRRLRFVEVGHVSLGMV